MNTLRTGISWCFNINVNQCKLSIICSWAIFRVSRGSTWKILVALHLCHRLSWCTTSQSHVWFGHHPMILTMFHDLRIKSPQLEPSNSSLGVERWGLNYKELSWFITPKTTETMVDTSNFIDLHRSTKFILWNPSTNIKQHQPNSPFEYDIWLPSPGTS